MTYRHGRLCLLLTIAVVAGCNRREIDGVKLVSVVGRVTIGGMSLTKGSLSFRPDPAKGNTSKYEPAAEVEEDGTYRLKTAGRDGAPPGWYKVMLVCVDPVDTKDPYAPRRSYVHPKYAALETTDLAINVPDGAASESGEAFELKVAPP
jgi:hypothetical protein